MKINHNNILNIVIAIGALILTFILKSPAIGLLIGLFIALVIGNISVKFTSKLSKYLLQGAVVLLGFKLQLGTVLSVGSNSIFITATSISTVFALGYFIGKLLKIDSKLTTLISGGTAICGGSAIAAIAPAIAASGSAIAISMSIVFLLNAIALFIFPPIGEFFNLTQNQFGLWAAIAIHDTSSVVGATAIYGSVAAAVGTTVKMTRALWIMPVSFICAKTHNTKSNAKFPLFLIGFLLASLTHTLFPTQEPLWNNLASLGKQLMTATLFLIGLSLTKQDLKHIGTKPLILAVTLWLIISIGTFILVKTNLLVVNI